MARLVAFCLLLSAARGLKSGSLLQAVGNADEEAGVVSTVASVLDDVGRDIATVADGSAGGATSRALLSALSAKLPEVLARLPLPPSTYTVPRVQAAIDKIKERGMINDLHKVFWNVSHMSQATHKDIEAKIQTCTQAIEEAEDMRGKIEQVSTCLQEMGDAHATTTNQIAQIFQASREEIFAKDDDEREMHRGSGWYTLLFSKLVAANFKDKFIRLAKLSQHGVCEQVKLWRTYDAPPLYSNLTAFSEATDTLKKMLPLAMPIFVGKHVDKVEDFQELGKKFFDTVNVVLKNFIADHDVMVRKFYPTIENELDCKEPVSSKDQLSRARLAKKHRR